MLAAFVWMALLTAALLVYPRRPRLAGTLVALMGVLDLPAPLPAMDESARHHRLLDNVVDGGVLDRMGPDLDRPLQQCRPARLAHCLLDGKGISRPC